MDSIVELKERLIDEFQRTQPVFYTSTNKVQNYVRCVFCGDSYNENHGHLSIKIDVHGDSPMVYRCLKCNVSGLVTDTFLEELGIFLDTNDKKILKSYTKRSMKVARLVNLDVENYVVPVSQNTDENKRKLEYLNERLGIQFGISEVQNHKIILSFFEFLKTNDLIKPDNDHLVGLHYSMMKALNDFYIGFLSTNNNCIVFRDITNSQRYRYFKVVLHEKNVNMDSFFSIPSKLHLLYTNPVEVHIAEGIFDILSIKENVIKETENHFYYASCGFGCVNILKYLIHHGINTNVTVRIYSDNDKTDWNHKKYLFNGSYLTEWIDHIYLHRNKYPQEKDYGVPANKITDTRRILK